MKEQETENRLKCDGYCGCVRCGGARGGDARAGSRDVFCVLLSSPDQILSPVLYVKLQDGGSQREGTLGPGDARNHGRNQGFSPKVTSISSCKHYFHVTTNRDPL